jgi:cytochrome c553
MVSTFTDHPLYPSLAAKSGSTTWRCKECHGWDYIGSEGRYSSGSHYTGIGGLLSSSLTKYQAFEAIGSGHGYSDAGLADADIWDLVALYTDGMFDLTYILDSDGEFGGNAASGQTLFETGIGSQPFNGCSVCHGTDGLTVVAQDYDAFPGMLSNENPQEFQHKVWFGHPGSAMPGMYDSGASVWDVEDVSTYAQSLACAAGQFWSNGSCQ